MVKIEKIANGTTPLGLHLIFDTEIIPTYDGNDFSVIQNSMKFSGTITAVNSKEYNFMFNEHQTSMFRIKESATFLYIVNDTNNEVIQGSEPFVFDSSEANQTPTVGCGSGGLDKNETEIDLDPCGDCTSDISFGVQFKDNQITLRPNDNLMGVLDTSVFSIDIEAYKFADYPEFVHENTEITDYDVVGNKINFDFTFDPNLIYRVFIELYNPTTDPTTITKSAEIMLGRPKYYFTTASYIKSVCEELDFPIDIVEDNAMKRTIWKYSQLAYLESGLHTCSYDTLDDLELTLFAEYVTHKILIQRYIGFIYNTYLGNGSGGGGSYFANGVSGGTMKLGDYQISETEGGIGTTIQNLSNRLNELFMMLKELSNSRAFSGFESYHYIVNRQAILPLCRRPMHVGKHRHLFLSDIDFKLMKRYSEDYYFYNG